MADQKFQQGDVVVLKSGSPKMTVGGSPTSSAHIRVYFYDFTTHQLELRDLPPATLMLAPEDKENW
jgi:uncharacterized protein YodC (DUF2158 family)